MKVDVLVIGGGIIGASCAYYLQLEGREVCLIEREESICPAACSTHENAGLISPSGVYPLPHKGVLGQGLTWLLDSSSCFYIKPSLSPSLASWLLRFAVASRDKPMRRSMPVVRKLGVAAGALYKDLDKAGLRGGYESNGILNLFITESAYQDAIRDFEPLKVFDVKTEAVGREGVRERVPAALPGVVGGTYEPEESQCDPAAMTCELARLAGENGATILTQTEALDFTVASRRITSVYTTRGSFEPITVVLAAGIWSRSLAKRLRLNLPLQPAKGYSITIPRPEGVPEHLPLYLSEPHICVTPYGDELRLAGTLELSGLNYRVMENRVAGIRRGANEFLGGVKHSEPLRVWRGLRPLSPDGIPIIGLSPKQDNLVVATGHNMSGLMFGPITGKLVAQMLTGQQPAVDLEPFRVDRFSATLTL